MAARKLLVDIHTHVYLPRYASFLRSRSVVPRIFSRTNEAGKSEERLLILDDEPSIGRPIGSQVSCLRLVERARLLADKNSAVSTGIEMKSSNSWINTTLTCQS